MCIRDRPNGLILKFVIYVGKDDCLGGSDHTAKVVMHLMEGKLNWRPSDLYRQFLQQLCTGLSIVGQQFILNGDSSEKGENNPACVMGKTK